jgi:hypothetical protein
MTQVFKKVVLEELVAKLVDVILVGRLWVNEHPDGGIEFILGYSLLWKLSDICAVFNLHHNSDVLQPKLLA